MSTNKVVKTSPCIPLRVNTHSPRVQANRPRLMPEKVDRLPNIQALVIPKIVKVLKFKTTVEHLLKKILLNEETVVEASKQLQVIWDSISWLLTTGLKMRDAHVKLMTWSNVLMTNSTRKEIPTCSMTFSITVPQRTARSMPRASRSPLRTWLILAPSVILTWIDRKVRVLRKRPTEVDTIITTKAWKSQAWQRIKNAGDDYKIKEDRNSNKNMKARRHRNKKGPNIARFLIFISKLCYVTGFWGVNLESEK